MVEFEVRRGKCKRLVELPLEVVHPCVTALELEVVKTMHGLEQVMEMGHLSLAMKLNV